MCERMPGKGRSSVFAMVGRYVFAAGKYVQKPLDTRCILYLIFDYKNHRKN